MKIKKNCLICHKEFFHRPSDLDAKFCGLYCKHESSRFWKNATDEQILNKLINSYEKKVIKKEGCWDWHGEFDRNNYGYFSHKRKRMYIHRASWLIYKGEIQDKLLVLHKCDNPKCSNPDHLFIGTYKDNTEDMIKKNRSRLTIKRKFNYEQIAEIKTLYNSGLSGRKIAKILNISQSSINDIISGRTYKNFSTDN